MFMTKFLKHFISLHIYMYNNIDNLFIMFFISSDFVLFILMIKIKIDNSKSNNQTQHYFTLETNGPLNKRYKTTPELTCICK